MIAWFVASHLVSRLVGGSVLRLFIGNLMGDLKAVVAFLKAHSIWLTVSIALCLCWGVDHVVSHRHAHKLETQLSKAIAGREADRRAYAKAQADAAALNKVQVAKVEQQQQKVTDDVETRYRADLARLHAEQLRPQAQRPANGSGASQASPAPSGPSSEAVPLSGPELLQAQETELQLNALIDWVIAQSSIDTNAH